jgi:hypothetical protein
MENDQEVAGGRRRPREEREAGDDYAPRFAAGPRPGRGRRGIGAETELQLSRDRVAQ